MMAVVDDSRTSTPDNLIRTVVAHIIHAQYSATAILLLLSLLLLLPLLLLFESL